MPTPSEILAAKKIMPTALTSAELEALGPELANSALFSARTTDAGYLMRLKQMLDRLLNPPDGNQLNELEMRAQLQEYWQDAGYLPEPGTEGSLVDLSSDRRIKLVIETNRQRLTGHADMIQGNRPAILAAFPALEFYRRLARNEERPWPQIWMNRGGPSGPDSRMIALKSDPIWARLSRWGNPAPPYDYNSGMRVRPIGRREALKRGLLQPGDQAQPMELLPFDAEVPS